MPHTDEQDSITGFKKKFFILVPDKTGALFGYKHFAAMLNKSNNCGWLGRTGLTSTMSDEDLEAAPDLVTSKTLVLIDFLQRRSCHADVDGVVIDTATNEVLLIKNIHAYLMKHKLESNTDAVFDVNKMER